jgi:hypothetical protein
MNKNAKKTQKMTFPDIRDAVRTSYTEGSPFCKKVIFKENKMSVTE